MKVCIIGPGHMIRMVPCSFTVKTLKNLMQNHLADFLETGQVRFGTLELKIMHK